MLKTINPTSLSTILQLLIDTADEDKFLEKGGNETNLSNPSVSKRSTKAGYLTSKSAKKGGNNPKRGGCNTKNSVKAARGSNYLTLVAKKAFNHLWYTFIQAPILQHFDPKWQIQTKTDMSDYAIDSVPSQLISNDLGQWHPLAYYSHKIIPLKTWYKTLNDELLPIVKTFKYDNII